MAADPQLRLERLLADALVHDDLDALRTGAESLPRELREAVAHVDPRGFRIAALLVAKLRFERLVQGSERAGASFREEPKTFADAFRRYHREVPPTAHDPRGEARLFTDWLDG